MDARKTTCVGVGAALLAAWLLGACGHGHRRPLGYYDPYPGWTTTATPAVGFTDFQAAETVIGQLDFTGSLANQGGAAAADTLADPFGRAAWGTLFVPDQGNHRVLVFDHLPNVNGGAADFVVGQPDLVTVTAATTAAKLDSPTDTWIAGDRLLVADRVNNRVLIWNGLPAASGMAADVVVGQADFVSSAPATTPSRLDQPASVCVADGKLFVADFANNRVLIWNHVPATSGTAADVVVGQADFVSGAPGATASRMSGPTSVWSDGNRLVVADRFNHRVLIWLAVPTSNGEPADRVVGQPDFVTIVPGGGPHGMDQPACVFATGAQLFVADRGNNRVLIYQPFPNADQPPAMHVLGQDNFTNAAPNDDDQDGAPDATPSDRTMDQPSGVSLQGKTLFVSDGGNHRVLVFVGT